MLSNQRNFKDEMRKIDITEIDMDKIERMQVYTKNPDYNIPSLMKISATTGRVADWVLTVERCAIMHHQLPQ